MKINWKMTKGLKDLALEDNSVFLQVVSFLIIPVITLILLFPFISAFSIMIGFGAMFVQLIASSIIYDELPITTEEAFITNWIPLILLAPITIPVDIFTSTTTGIWNWFSKKKTEKKVRNAWEYLIEKGLNPKKIDFDKLDKPLGSLSEISNSLFKEVISDQLGRTLIKKSEEIEIVRCEEHGGKICVIGLFTVSEKKPRSDGSNNTTVQGRVFGITFSLSKHTGICKVIHQISQPLSEVHEDEHVEDIWFNLINSSGISSESAKDPLERRRAKHFVDTRSGVIIQDKPVGDPTGQQTELT